MVTDAQGNRATAALSGEGIDGLGRCRPYLVPCNYAHNYTGSITLITNERTDTDRSRRGMWWRELHIRVEYGVAICNGNQRDSIATYDADGKLTSVTKSTGDINGPGLFAVEFERSDGRLEYTLSFACPSALVNTTTTTYELRVTDAGYYIQPNTETAVTPNEPADWRHVTLAADPRPATQVLMAELRGRQQDPRPDLGDDVIGGTDVSWSLGRMRN